MPKPKKRADASAAQVIRVRKPGPGLLTLVFPFTLTTRADGIHICTYAVQTPCPPEPTLDHVITERLISKITRGTGIGLFVDQQWLTTYRSVGRMPRPHPTPRIVTDRFILAAAYEISKKVGKTQVRFVHHATGRPLGHDRTAPLNIREVS